MSNANLERRQAKRTAILEHFSFYICIPKLGLTRHKVNDISERGIGFLIETLGEFKLQIGEICELQFYLNQSFCLPLKIEVVRQIDHESTQEVGAVFLDLGNPTHQAFSTLVKLMDQLTDVGEFRI